MTDCIDPVPFLVALALIVAVLLGLGIRDRRRTRNAVRRWHVAVARFSREAHRGACAWVWWDPSVQDYHVCTRPVDHPTALHVDEPYGARRYRP